MGVGGWLGRGILIWASVVTHVFAMGCCDAGAVRLEPAALASSTEARSGGGSAPGEGMGSGEGLQPRHLSMSKRPPVPGEEAVKATPIPLPEDAALRKLVLQAREDLAGRLRTAPEKIDLVEVRQVVWPDKGLGCPRPGMAYLQVQVDGLLIRFSAGGRFFQYHGGGGRAPFLCENPSAEPPGGSVPSPPPGFGDP